MKVLLDTHSVIWWFLADKRLSPAARAAIEDPLSNPVVSAVSAFEITTKVRLGKLNEAREIADRFEWLCTQGNFDLLPIRADHALLAGRMMSDHRDPFDRLLAAQAIIEGLPILTIDPAIRGLGAAVLW